MTEDGICGVITCMIALSSRGLRCAVVFSATLLLASCDVFGLSLGDRGRRADFERQRAKWERQGISSYRLIYRQDCFCGTEFTVATEIEVRGGSIVGAHYAASNDPIPSYVQSRLPTIESLFDIIADAIEREVDLLDVSYDPDRGFPRKIAIDYRFNTADDEVTHSVLGFEIVLPPIVP